MTKLFERVRAFTQSDFFKGTFTYLAGSVLNAALPLLLLPVLTRHLSPADYGIMATAAVLTQILVVLIGVNAYGLFARSHFDNDAGALTRLVSTGFFMSLVVTVFVGIVVTVAAGPLEHFTEFPAAWMPAVIAVSIGTVVQQNYLSLLQARNEPKRYIVLQTIGSLLNLALSLALVLHWHMDWRGRMWALLAAQTVAAAFCLHGLIARLGVLGPEFSRAAYRQLLAFGVPLIPHVLGGWVMTMSARLFLNNMSSLAETGLYSVAFNLTSPLAMIVGAANNAYVPTLFAQLSRTDDWDRRALCRKLILTALALPVLALIFAFALRWIMPLIVGPRFHGTSEYVTWMALTYAVQGIYFIFGNFVVYSKRTSLMTLRADFLGGIVLLAICPLLIRWNGPVGAAQAVCIAFAASTIGCITAARQAFPMPWAAAIGSLVGRRSELRSAESIDSQVP